LFDIGALIAYPNKDPTKKGLDFDNDNIFTKTLEDARRAERSLVGLKTNGVSNRSY